MNLSFVADNVLPLPFLWVTVSFHWNNSLQFVTCVYAGLFA